MNAQSDASVRVIVNSDKDGSAVIGAQVVLKSYSEVDGVGKIEDGGVTDNDGLYETNDVAPGKYQLEISYIGYKTYKQIIELESGELMLKRVELEVTVEELDDVVVEAERRVTTGDVGVEKISDIEVGRLPAPGTGGDLASYLQTLPGVVSSGDRGGDINIRGGTAAQNGVLVDNMPIFKPFHISNLFSAFPSEAIKNVDLYAGGFGAEYMGSTSAIVDVKLRPGNMKEFSASGAASPYLTSIQLEGPLSRRYRHSFMLMGRKSIYNHTAPTLLGQQESGINFYDVVGRYAYQGYDFKCNITGIRTFDRGKINTGKPISVSWKNTVIGGRCLGYSQTWEHPIEVTVGYSDYSNSESPPFRSSSRSQAFAKVDHERELFGLSVNYGFGINYNFYTTELTEEFSSVQSFDAVQAIFHLYGSSTWNPNKYFTLEPSIGTQISFQTSFEPRLRISYRPDGTNDKELSLAVGRYYQFTNGIKDPLDGGSVFTVHFPTEDEFPVQRALQGLIGYEHHMGNAAEFNVEGFVKRYKNISVPKWTPVVELNVRKSLGELALAEGLAYGFDFQFEYRKNPIYFSLGYGYSKVEFEALSDNLGAWIQEPVFSYTPSFDQRHKLNSLLSYSFAGFTSSLSWEFGSGKPYTKTYGFDWTVDVPDENPLDEAGTPRVLYDQPYGGRFPTYHRLDISLKKTFELSPQSSLETEIGVLNVYNRRNIFYFDVSTLQRINQTPRMPYVSVKAHI